MKELNFQTSKLLKDLFNIHFEKWNKLHPGGIEELGRRCGVGRGYLSHIRRYGRIPGKPVLILLSLHFKVDGNKLFEAASISEAFPIDPKSVISNEDPANKGFLNVHIDMEGFSSAIKSIVRSEIKQRSIEDLLLKRPIRVGVNLSHYWMLNQKSIIANPKLEGLFIDFATMLGVALRKEIELVPTTFSDYLGQLKRGEIDLFGPMMIVPELSQEVFFTNPIHSLGVSGIMRAKETPELAKLKAPKSFEDLQNRDYQVAVLNHSHAHILCKTLLKRTDQDLILCDSDEEALERVTLKSIKRQAHIFITNSLNAVFSCRNNPKELLPLFTTRGTLIDMQESSLAVRPDWPELTGVLNDAIKFLLHRGGFNKRISELFKGELREVVEV